MPNVIIGENSIIAAHSFVNKNIPENEIWKGIPAKFYKKINS
jgi:acetyltransferase-like isoleucine patch superfamily enzyme